MIEPRERDEEKVKRRKKGGGREKKKKRTKNEENIVEDVYIRKYDEGLGRSPHERSP